MTQREPVRELRLSSSLRVYISDMACVVIEQDMGDVTQVFFHDHEIDELISALRALGESAAAKRSALDTALEAEYRAAFGEDA